mmetsp:Transcript_61170/g.131997  ORF Transcript_61170/g.131997 Transcript_61170/m.131997 type:complete len:274 (+) Transcript_61170:21-842(+)
MAPKADPKKAQEPPPVEEKPPTPPPEEEPVVEEPDILPSGLEITLKEADISELWKGEDAATRCAFLAGQLDIPTYTSDFRAEVLLEYHLNNLMFCKEICLTPRKAAMFHAIMREVLAYMKEQSGNLVHRGEPMTSGEVFARFRELILAHSGRQSEGVNPMFLGSEARRLTDYATNGLFKHFLLFQYTLLPLGDHGEKAPATSWGFDREAEILRVQAVVEEPCPSLDLNTAKPLEAVETPASMGYLEGGHFLHEDQGAAELDGVGPEPGTATAH